MKGLTKRQREILDFLQEYISKNQFSPSYREVMQKFGFSSLGSVYKHVHLLRRKGFLNSEKGCSRSLSVANQQPEKERDKTPVRMIGYLVAGNPIETLPKAEIVDIPISMVPHPDITYALRAKSDSLNEEFIAEGDLLIVEARSEAQDGEMVIAIVNHHDTLVKRYCPEGSYIRLESQNPYIQPIMLRRTDITIQGVMIALLRLYPL
jgi:repressor LexA